MSALQVVVGVVIAESQSAAWICIWIVAAEAAPACVAECMSRPRLRWRVSVDSRQTGPVYALQQSCTPQQQRGQSNFLLCSTHLNRSVFSLLCWLSVWHCPHFLLSTGACSDAVTAEHWHLLYGLSIDICCLQGAQQQTPTHHCCCRTDGRTDTQPLHRPCSAYYVGSVNNSEACFALCYVTDATITVEQI